MMRYWGSKLEHVFDLDELTRSQEFNPVLHSRADSKRPIVADHN